MTAPDAPSTGGTAAAGPVVLVVDDEAPARMLLKKVVQGLYPSAQLHEASDGETALRVARTAHPNLVLLDISLPGSDKSGVLVCQELTRAQIPVIIVSGNATGSVLQACLSLGAADILRKPFTIEDAQAKIRYCLGG